MFFRIQILISCFFLVSRLPVDGQEKYRAVHWSKDEKMTPVPAFGAIKHLNGFVWFGTRGDGLFRFDGRLFRNYRHQANKNSISGNDIGGLIEDSLHNIWIGTETGLSLYDISADTFKTVAALSAKRPSGIEYAFVPFWATKDEVFFWDYPGSQLAAFNIHTLQKRQLAKISPDDIGKELSDQNSVFDAADGNFYVSNQGDIWPEIENDFRFAMENLNDKMEAKGRANKYAAEAFLAKAYIFQQKYDSAKPLLNDLIQHGVTAGGIPYALEKHFHDNFNPETKNSSESVFAAQTSVNDGSFGNNGNSGDILNYPYGGGPGGCCGFFQPSQYLVNHFKTYANGLPDLDNYNLVDVKSDQGLSSTDPFSPYSGPLDPRLDWTVGRRGIPYLDWGDHPGGDWIRNQVYGGPYAPMKNAYSQSQQQHLTDASFWSSGAVANNINLIRFADVMLWAAEMEIEVGSLEKAREYVNQIRSRAADPSTWVTRPNGNYAANYKIGLYTSTWTDPVFARKAIRYERMLELGMEGHRFFDLVRWGIADVEINAYFQKEKSLRFYMNTAVFTKNKNEYFPIPQTQIDLSAGSDGVAKLTQNPGY
jgi:hypothetical protein